MLLMRPDAADAVGLMQLVQPGAADAAGAAVDAA